MKLHHQHWNSMAMQTTTQLGNHLNQETLTITLNWAPLQSSKESVLKVKDWMDAVRLKLNESKTKFIYFGSRQQLKNAPLTKLTLLVKAFKEVTQLNI